MTHHAPFARRSRMAVAPVTLLLVAFLAACSNDDDPPADTLVTGALRIVVTAASPVRGVQLDMSHGVQIAVLDVTPGTPFGGGTCAENLEAQRVRLGCVSNADIGSPFTGWTLAVQHSTSVDPLDAVTAVSCTGSDATGLPVAVTCSVE